MQKKYKIINTTVKPPRPDKNGKDARSNTERVGYAVSFRDKASNPIVITKDNPRIVDDLNEGLLRLARSGDIRIEEIDDVVTALKKHVYTGKAVSEADKLGSKAKRQVSTSQSLFAPDENVEDGSGVHVSHARKAKAIEMGKDGHAQESGTEHEGAVNPDGDPNFLVTVNKDLKRKQRFKRN